MVTILEKRKRKAELEQKFNKAWASRKIEGMEDTPQKRDGFDVIFGFRE